MMKRSVALPAIIFARKRVAKAAHEESTENTFIDEARTHSLPRCRHRPSI